MSSVGRSNGWRGPERACALCARLYIPKHPNGRYCSHACSKRRRDQSKRSTKARHALYERDGWVCYLCGGPVDRSGVFGPLSPALDHVVPLSDPSGPGDVVSNIKTAHSICNSRKSVKPFDVLGVSTTRVVQYEEE